MASRLRPLRVLIPAGLLSGCAVAAFQAARPSEDTTEEGASESEPVSTSLATQLEAWLMPTDGPEGLGQMVKELHDAVSEDIKISADEGKRLPLNFLMVKAMHDRELLVSTRTGKRKTHISRRLRPMDRRILQRSAHYARFAAASYDGVIDTMKELAEEDIFPPPDLFSQSTEYVRKWLLGKRTRIDPDDVKELASSDSLETRTFFVAVDHVSRSVVVSIRGTHSFTDTMVDLLCNPVDFAGGKAHQGISQSALRVWKTVKATVEQQLREHKDYKLVLTGHSLGAGTAILLKVLLARNAAEVLKGGAYGKGEGTEPLSARLDAGRPVRVECYAFAPPPVFSAPGADWMRGVYSFVNGADCVPTMSLGSVYSLYRTIQKVDQLPLDVYKRAEFVLDARVRVQQKEQGVETEDVELGRRKVAHGILGLRTHPSLSFLGFGSSSSSSTNCELGRADENPDNIWEEDEEAVEDEVEPEDEEGLPWETATANNGETDGVGEGDGSSDDEDNGGTFAAGAEAAVRSTISRVGGEWTRLTQDVSEATEGLLAAVNKAGTSVGDAADAVVEATSGIRGMTSEEVALTALLLKQLAAGGGPTPDQVLQLVQKCEREGYRPQKGVSRCSEKMAVGDLIIPGDVYLLEGWDAEAGARKGDSEDGKVRRGGVVRVRKTSSAELGGIRLHSNMMADHSMNAYEPAIVAAAQRYKKRRDANPARRKV